MLASPKCEEKNNGKMTYNAWSKPKWVGFFLFCFLHQSNLWCIQLSVVMNNDVEVHVRIINKIVSCLLLDRLERRKVDGGVELREFDILFTHSAISVDANPFSSEFSSGWCRQSCLSSPRKHIKFPHYYFSPSANHIHISLEQHKLYFSNFRRAAPLWYIYQT